MLNWSIVSWSPKPSPLRIPWILQGLDPSISASWNQNATPHLPTTPYCWACWTKCGSIHILNMPPGQMWLITALFLTKLIQCFRQQLMSWCRTWNLWYHFYTPNLTSVLETYFLTKPVYLTLVLPTLLFHMILTAALSMLWRASA